MEQEDRSWKSNGPMSDGALSAVRDEDTGNLVGAGASRQGVDCAVQSVVYRLSVRSPLECFENLRETGREILFKGHAQQVGSR